MHQPSGDPGQMNPAARAVIAWGGDVNLGRRQHARAAALPSPVLDVPVLREADLTIVNLECVVSPLGTPALDKGEKGPYHFRARPDMLRVLTEAGVNVVVTANNHSGDYGPAAMLDQHRWLAAAGIGQVGSGLDDVQAFRPLWCDAGPFLIALFAVDTTQASSAAGPGRPGHAYLRTADLNGLRKRLAGPIRFARRFASAVLVAVHAGRNFAAEPDAHSRAFCRTLIDLGADAVLGASAHVVQGVEIHKGRPILHDAGDLLFDAVQRQDHRGGVFSLTLGSGGIERVGFTPLRVDFGHSRQDEGAHAESTVACFMARSEALGSHFTRNADGTAFLALSPQGAPRPVRDLPQLRAAQVPAPEWLADEVPAEARLPAPCDFGPLQLLGLRIGPPRLDGRALLRVTSFWRLAAHPLAQDWRLEIRAVCQDGAQPPLAWGGDSDHDPCDWMHPTSLWRPGLVYRDEVLLRPPPKDRLRSGVLDVLVRVIGPGQRHAWVRMPQRIVLDLPATRGAA